VHTDPDDATGEIDALHEAVIFARSTHPDERDFIVMGDLNADGTYFDEDGPSAMRSEEYTWVIDNSVDTTTGSNTYTYDRIIVTQQVLSDFTGESGAYHFNTEYGLTSAEKTAVSDHYPVYMELYIDRDED
jgi:endonuclease/exonuclease/phosphatase family metal-dependent hydrolase